ncbi:TMhelix containing protein [Vibrio phage 1.121.O._10N.286.46.C4]|nr:TMhelix containing protein [Vibrio phage 1.121.O._10N.286.46.C4]
MTDLQSALLIVYFVLGFVWVLSYTIRPVSKNFDKIFMILFLPYTVVMTVFAGILFIGIKLIEELPKWLKEDWE